MADTQPTLLQAGIRPSIQETTLISQLFTQVGGFYQSGAYSMVRQVRQLPYLFSYTFTLSQPGAGAD